MKKLAGLILLSMVTCALIISPIHAKDAQPAKESEGFTIPVKDIQRFSTVIAQIKRYYIEPTTDKELFNNAIKGLLTNLDPHSAFLDEDDLKDLETVTTGEFGGIGVEIIPDNGFIKVIAPLDDTPAYKAGIKAGDMIVRINNEVIKKMTVRDAINKIRGKRGSLVDLTVIRKGEKKPLKFSVARDVIKVDSIKSRMLDDGFGYIRIVFFQANAKTDLQKAIEKLQKDSNGKLNGIVIDLRNNPGGLLDAAIHITDTFLDADKLTHDKLIVYTKGRIPGTDIRAKATGNDLTHGIPIVVLINGGSASASEIVAGALQDYKRAILVGTKSFGKGSVQTIIPIDDTSGIKLTTALYFTPAGRSIQATGIVPDITVPELKVEKSDDLDSDSDQINEADLGGHLANANLPAKKMEAPASPTPVTMIDLKNLDVSQLAYKDYQLYTALTLLKAMHASK